MNVLVVDIGGSHVKILLDVDGIVEPVELSRLSYKKGTSSDKHDQPKGGGG
jgi:hypothetical protein